MVTWIRIRLQRLDAAAVHALAVWRRKRWHDKQRRAMRRGGKL